MSQSSYIIAIKRGDDMRESKLQCGIACVEWLIAYNQMQVDETSMKYLKSQLTSKGLSLAALVECLDQHGLASSAHLAATRHHLLKQGTYIFHLQWKKWNHYVVVLEKKRWVTKIYDQKYGIQIIPSILFNLLWTKKFLIVKRLKKCYNSSINEVNYGN